MTQTTEQKDAEFNQTLRVKETPFVEVTKEFNVPVEEVWKAWSDAELMKQWTGPEGYTCPTAKTDFRIEGKYLYAMKSPEGQVTWSTGVYQEILPLELIVCSDQFADEKGNTFSPVEAGMGEGWEDADMCLFSVKFEKIDDAHTRIQLVHEGIPAAMHDDCVQGWSSSLDKMKKLLEKN